MRGTLARLRQDTRRLRRHQAGKFGYAPITWFLDPAWICVLLHRFSHLLWRRGWGKASRLLMQANSLITGADIQPGSDLCGGLLIPSPCGVNISAKAGENLTALPLAGIGGSLRDRDRGAGIGLPLLGRDVTAGWFTGIQGSITVGDGAVFGPGSSSIVDVAPGARVALKRPPLERRRASLHAPVPPSPIPPSPVPSCGHARWRHTRAELDADLDRYLAELSSYGPPGRKPPPRLSALLTNPLLALLAYRVSHWLWLNGWRRSGGLLCRANILLHKVTIPPAACLGGGVLMPHLAGVVFNGQAGARLTLYAGSLCTCHGSALAAGPDDGLAASPVLGDDVLVAGHAGAFGPIRVGSGAQIGPKAQLAETVGPGSGVWDPLPWSGPLAAGEAELQKRAEQDVPPSHPLPAGHPWRETARRLQRDRARLLEAGLPGFPALLCVRLHRLSHALHATGWRRPGRWAWLANAYLTGADITPACELGAGLLIPHPAGVALHCRAGEGLTVGATAGITAPLDRDDRPSSLDHSPRLGSQVDLAHHSGVSGAVTVGDGVLLQPGCIATRSVQAGMVLLPRTLRIRVRAMAGPGDP